MRAHPRRLPETGALAKVRPTLRGASLMLKLAAALAALLVVPVVQAQDVPTVAAAADATVAQPAAADSPATTDVSAERIEVIHTSVMQHRCCRLPAGTQVDLQLGETLSSARHKRGDRFTLRLSQPLAIDGAEPIPAGTPAVGEVVHGARSRGGGAPGELLIAGRYLEHNGRQIPLRGLSVGQSGRERINGAMGAAFVIGPFAMFVRGSEIEIPADTVLSAKLAQDLDLPLLGATTAEPALSPAAAPAPLSPSPSAQAGDASSTQE
ncbi:hypothetical protein LVB77_05210 [Lysobacter sp. 5GHs7-4]|uniref:hypothetical protein n=1 Tax=Lysobacter sp. 5GHs7-4 TaxID=2904253 RepID=UPI001E3D845F|nr:hypothetical protein [Lysobacter sp. 5GHs7-4]UHQ24113.1 hypothetical protein LVB77_05210 [Lysobacter sp. 5GHs7-4]